MARDLRAEFGLRTFALHGSGGIPFEGLSPQERAYGFHAGEVETAFLLAAAPELVDRSAYTVNYIARHRTSRTACSRKTPPQLSPGSPATSPPSGVMGDPRPATAENGARWLDAGCRATRCRTASDVSLSANPASQP